MIQVDNFFAVGIQLDENKKRVPGTQPKVVQHSNLDYANSGCGSLYKEGYNMTFVAAGVKCIFNKETKKWELPEGFEVKPR
jgi:hypothetical protein